MAFEDLDGIVLIPKILTIDEKIGDANPSSGSWDSLFEALLKIYNKTVGHQVITKWGTGDTFTEYATTSDSYSVKETITFTFNQTPTSGWDYIKLNLGLQIKSDGTHTCYGKWEVGFGSSPSSWTTLTTYSTTSSSYSTHQDYFILSPTIFDDTTNIIKVRWSIKNSNGLSTVYGKRYGIGTCEAFWR